MRSRRCPANATRPCASRPFKIDPFRSAARRAAAVGARGFTYPSPIPICWPWPNGKNPIRASRRRPRLSCARCSPKPSATHNPSPSARQKRARTEARSGRTRLNRLTNPRVCPAFAASVVQIETTRSRAVVEHAATGFPFDGISFVVMSPAIFGTKPCARLTNQHVDSGMVVPAGSLSQSLRQFHIQRCRPKKPATKITTTTTPMM